ncbi:MAG: rhamnosyltransferase [Bradyrhizobium sp.]|nr:rhamnosyltransferase [Bradyrhizobium sp.]
MSIGLYWIAWAAIKCRVGYPVPETKDCASPGERREEDRRVAICCIVVCYRPDVAQVMCLCRHVLADGATVVLVDNTEVPYLGRDKLPDGCTLITLGCNSGIGRALNVGVARALAAGAAVIAFFDQDSKVDPGLLKRLAAAIQPGIPEIVSPLCVDDRTNAALPSLRLSRHGMSTPVHRADLSSRYPVDIVISSGTVATREVFDLAGTFDESLFIDFVDTEWCLRCRGKQIPIYVIPTAVMRHSIGSRHFRFGPLTILVHNPTRCYYQIRNSFLLLRKRHVPPVFSVKQIISVVSSRIVLLFGVEDRTGYIKAYWSAVRDGIRGISGARPD